MHCVEPAPGGARERWSGPPHRRKPTPQPGVVLVPVLSPGATATGVGHQLVCRPLRDRVDGPAGELAPRQACHLTQLVRHSERLIVLLASQLGRVGTRIAGTRPGGAVGPPDMAGGIEVQTEPVRLPGEAAVASKATASEVRRARPPAESGTAMSPAPVSRAPANWAAQHSPSMTSVVPHRPAPDSEPFRATCGSP